MKPKFVAPFPYFGGKSKIAPLVWEHLGPDVGNYIEPFFGSGACLLARPGWTPESRYMETVNDIDGYVANFWRALQHDPDQVAYYADWPVNENDLHARHAWLVEHKDDLPSKLEGDPDWYDPKIAGWWAWGISAWIGGAWCGGKGPWFRVKGRDGIWRLVKDPDGMKSVHEFNHADDDDGGTPELVRSKYGVTRRRIKLADSGHGLHRKSVHFRDGGEDGTGKNGIISWMRALSSRLRRVRVACGDWSRVCSRLPTINFGTTAIFLDPPYSGNAKRSLGLYSEDSSNVALDVREWCIKNGDNPQYRIALCGYDGEYDMPDNWKKIRWSAGVGYARQAKHNRHREVVWFSPHCLQID